MSASLRLGVRPRSVVLTVTNFGGLRSPGYLKVFRPHRITHRAGSSKTLVGNHRPSSHYPSNRPESCRPRVPAPSLWRPTVSTKGNDVDLTRDGTLIV